MANGDCASNICSVGTMQSFCSLACTPENAAEICPVPPFDGTCNMRGFCKKPK
jgi:hypothetical protein